MADKLKGKTIAILATDGFEESELTEPLEAVRDEGAEVFIISLKPGDIQGFRHDEIGQGVRVDKTVDQVKAVDYDGLILPGGVRNPDTLRTSPTAVRFVRDFFDQKKPVAAICHGPWMLVEANVVNGRTLTSWPSLKTDIENAGGMWRDEEVVVDNGLVSSRNPSDLPSFCDKMVEEMAEGRHDMQAA